VGEHQTIYSAIFFIQHSSDNTALRMENTALRMENTALLVMCVTFLNCQNELFVVKALSCLCNMKKKKHSAWVLSPIQQSALPRAVLVSHPHS